jgi:hypothetical protein
MLCFSGIVLCLRLGAQTSANPPAPTETQNSISNSNDSQFPHQQKAPPSEVVPASPETPLLWNGYETHFAVEFGGRALSNTGNGDMYATFVNLQPGVRLLDQSLEMHSRGHNGLLFDDLSESSFGLGGDPNELVQLRASKHHWYDFSGTWRRDINFWDYNLFGNPLNPPTVFPFSINVSPALLDLSRKMLDLNLTVFPDSKIQFVLGYSRYNNAGPSFTTVHEGTEAELFQPWSDISDSYHFGVSWRPAERTRLSYDQFYTHNRSGTSDYLNFFPYRLSNGTPVNLGISAAPCGATTFLGPYANPSCNLFTGYSDTAPYYTDIPTEQIGFQTSYLHRLHVGGRASYTGAQTELPNAAEIYKGFTSRDHTVQSMQTGSGTIQEITTSADFGVTYDVTEALSISDQFRWYAYRIPSGAEFLQTSLFSTNSLASPNPFSPATCPAPYTASTCPQHSAGSGPDVSNSLYSMFQSQNQKRNTFTVDYDFSAKLTAYAGYRFERQDFVIDGSTMALLTYFPRLANRAGCRPVISGVCHSSTVDISTAAVQINDHAAIAGIAARPIKDLHLNADVEIVYADNVFTNIMPRHMQTYRGKAIYSRGSWLTLTATTRIQNMRNLADGLGNLQHNRSASAGVIFMPSERFGVDLNYTYDNLFKNLNVCFVETPVPALAATTPLCSLGYLTALSYYRNVDNFASAHIMAKPLKRMTLTAGYSITSTTGSNLVLNPLAPLGPIAINYHLPSAAVAVEMAKHLTLKGGWNLYEYREKSSPGTITPRNFNANLISISLRYAM